MKFKIYVDFTTEDSPRAFYVGKGTEPRVKKRKRNKLHRVISEKYGLERKIVFETDNEQEAFEKETQLILEYNTYVYGDGWGANFTLGGEGTSGSPRYHLRGESHPMFGKKHSEESKRKNSESNKIAQSGEKNGMFGKHHSEETKKKIGDNQRGWHHTDEAKAKLAAAAKRLHTGKKRSEETRRKISESRKGKPPWNKGKKTANQQEKSEHPIYEENS